MFLGSLYMDMKAGERTAVSIRMKNSEPVRAFQFKMFLPEGVEAVKNSKNKYIATLNRERLDETDEHTLSVAEQQDGSILFIYSSMHDEDFATGDVEVIRVPVQVAADMTGGSHAVTLQQLVMTGSDNTTLSEVNVVKSTITGEEITARRFPFGTTL